MGIFDNNKEREREDWAIIGRLLGIIETQAQIIRNCCKAHKVKLVYNFSNDKNTQTMDVSFILGGSSKSSTPSLIDQKTGLPVTGTITYSNAQVVVVDPTIGTVQVDPVTAIATATPLAVGTTTFTITAIANYTDSNDNPVSGSVPTAPINLTVSVAADGVTLEYNIWA